jgi:hypothetical protein
MWCKDSSNYTKNFFGGIFPFFFLKTTEVGYAF